MFARPLAVVLGAYVALAACDRSAENASNPSVAATPQPTATVVRVVEVPEPSPSPSSAPTVEVMPQPTACGSEKLQNYLNLLPTSTANDEIAKTLGHDRIRYVPLQAAKASVSAASNRVTAGLGVDGRIKVFVCG